ncbi:MAG: hypothetical protein KBF66_09850 [Rhodoferax sp.]|uniref:hypothetical protein n=1 Tax=Rhodoferax sp. TaxID=50421 RepID=UPI001B60C632|nr:hypothetical protein [Rhodoferax sp.]MBP9905850.1 hypothetical protein [Rhodoferax sp.]
MNPPPSHFFGVFALCLASCWCQPALAQLETGLQAVTELAQVNGQAMACQEMGVAARAKALMLRHAPKTARFGNAFDEGTHAAFLAQTRAKVDCPDEATLRMQLTALALRLQDSLPADASIQPSPRKP